MTRRDALELIDAARRALEEGRRQARKLFADIPATEEPTEADLWQAASPNLEKALTVYDRKESTETPDSSWLPGRTTKRTCQADLEAILDKLLDILGACAAVGYRQRIRELQADNVTGRKRIAEYREQLRSAPAEEAQNILQGVLRSSKESLDDSLADETDRIAQRSREIETLKIGFREHLQHIGITVSPETADSFLLPVEDGVVSMAAVISNIATLTGRLQELVEESREAPEEARRYYGIYVLLVLAVNRVQTHFVNQIDEHFLPMITGFKNDAARHITEAQAQLSHDGPRDVLKANIAANQRTIESCRLMTDTLQSQRRSVADENRKVRVLEAAAVNTYRTVSLSLNVAEFVGYCEAAFRSLRELRLPQLRPFQGVQLNDELRRLAERVAERT